MRILSQLKNVIPTGLLAALLLFCFTPFTHAESAVTITEGVVHVDPDDGTVLVMVVCEEPQGPCEDLVPSNGQGLLRSGQIAEGDIVVVKIVQDKKHKHRGHVTILK